MDTMEQALHFAATGLRVAWFGITMAHAGRDLCAMADTVTDRPEVQRIVRTNGVERIDFESGGWVRPFAAPRGARGVTLDAAYLPDWQLIRDDDFMDTLLPSFATREHPRIGVII